MRSDVAGGKRSGLLAAPLERVLAWFQQLRFRRAIAASVLFDRDRYLAENPDVAAAKRDPLDHYMKLGAYEGRTPHALFDGLWYLEQNPDVSAARLNPLGHYLTAGGYQGRNPHPLFDSQWYLEQYPDVRDAKVNPLEHYVRFGAREGRNPHPLFDSAWYLERNPDLRGTGVNPLEHYVRHGGFEGRDPHPLFDSDWYLAQNPEVAAKGVNPFVHYLTSGARAGSIPHPLFDGDWYLVQHPDVATAGLNPLLHYVREGAAAGFDPHPMFDTKWYLAERPDVAKAGVNPLIHYLLFGANEGVDPSPIFDGQSYLLRYGDVAKAGFNPLVHYVGHGRRDGITIKSNNYRGWIWQYDQLTDEDRAVFRRAIADLTEKPLISIIMAVDLRNAEGLARTIDSVCAQLYGDWELWIAVDTSGDPRLRQLIEDHCGRDARVRVLDAEKQTDASAGWNAAVKSATGPFVAILDCGDELAEHALFWLAKEIIDHPDVDLIYNDEDRIDAQGRRHDPHFKPDWGAALFASQDMFGRLGVYRRTLVEQVGGFRSGLGGKECWDLALRCADATREERIRHVPRVLCHRHVGEAPGADAASSQSDWNASARVVDDHLARRGVAGKVVPALGRYCQVEYAATAPLPKVSIIVPSTGRPDLLDRCIDSALTRTTYPDFELLIAVNEVAFENQATAAYLKSLEARPRVRVLAYENEPYNFSRVNNWAVKRAAGTVLCFMNDDVEVITPDWLEKMVTRLRLERVGAVGPMLYFPNGTIQHAGIILGLWGVAGHCFMNWPHGSAGYFGRAALEQDLSCVTAACMAMHRDLFEQLEGFNEALAIAFNDVDLCVRIRKAGRRVIWTPSVELVHHQSATLGPPNTPARQAQFDRETRLMRELWGETLDHDPFYSPNLSLSSSDFTLAIPPRLPKLPPPQMSDA